MAHHASVIAANHPVANSRQQHGHGDGNLSRQFRRTVVVSAPCYSEHSMTLLGRFTRMLTTTAIAATLAMSVPAVASAQGTGTIGLRASDSRSPGFGFDSARVAGSQWKTGMIAGGVTGAFLGTLFAVAVEQSCDNHNCGTSLVPFVAVVTVAAALAGALIGSFFPRR
jgi:hypothetical protein